MSWYLSFSFLGFNASCICAHNLNRSACQNARVSRLFWKPPKPQRDCLPYGYKSPRPHRFNLVVCVTQPLVLHFSVRSTTFVENVTYSNLKVFVRTFRPPKIFHAARAFVEAHYVDSVQ